MNFEYLTLTAKSYTPANVHMSKMHSGTIFLHKVVFFDSTSLYVRFHLFIY